VCFFFFFLLDVYTAMEIPDSKAVSFLSGGILPGDFRGASSCGTSGLDPSCGTLFIYGYRGPFLWTAVSTAPKLQAIK